MNMNMKHSHNNYHYTIMFFNSQSLTLKGDDYKAWSNDDSYLYTYVANKLGYTVAPTPAPESQ